MKRIVCIGANAIALAEKPSPLPPVSAPCRRDTGQNHSRTYSRPDAMDGDAVASVQLSLFED